MPTHDPESFDPTDPPVHLIDASWTRWERVRGSIFVRPRPLPEGHPLTGELAYWPQSHRSRFRPDGFRSFAHLTAERGPLREIEPVPEDERHHLHRVVRAAGPKAVASVAFAVHRFLDRAERQWGFPAADVIGAGSYWGSTLTFASWHPPIWNALAITEDRTDPAVVTAITEALPRWTTHPRIFREPGRPLTEITQHAVHGLGGWQQATDRALRDSDYADIVQDWALCHPLDDCEICAADHYMGSIDIDDE
ncbi:hypothetical protein [Streptomyces sp. NPDC002537]